MTTFATLEEQIRNNKYNAENSFYHSLDAMSDVVVAQNATMPLIALLEHQVLSSTVTNSEIDLVNRYLNPNYCDTHETLARHLDYRTLNTIHAIPANTTITLALGVQDLYNYSYMLQDGTRRVVIPEDTVIGYKDEIYYGIHHAIQITLRDNETIDVSYIDNKNPLLELTNPVIESRFRNSSDISNSYTSKTLEFDIVCYQFKRTNYTYPVNETLGFTKTYTLTDQYYHARVFSRSGTEWIELNTYFSEFIYNSYSDVGAVVVALSGDQLTLKIPQIFFNRGMIGTEVKVVLYTTKGDINADYGLSLLPDWSVVFNNNDSRYNLLVNPLTKFRDVYVYGNGKLLSGVDIPTVDTLRKKILLSDDGNAPVSEAQLESRLNNLGYNLVHEHNYVSDNLYLASKRLDDIELSDSTVMVSGGGLDIILGDLSDCHGVISNGSNYTLTPSIRCKLDNGLLTVLSNSEVNTLSNLGLEDTLSTYNTGNYLATPFYYLIEQLEYNTLVSVFDMDDVAVTYRDFIGSNTNTNGLISTRDYTLSKVTTGYKLTIVAITNDSFLNYDDDSFIPQLVADDVDGTRYSIIGTMLGRGPDGEFIYEFLLDSTYDLSYLGTTKLTSITNSINGYNAKLEDTFQLTYNLVKDLPNDIGTTYRASTDSSKLPAQYQVITLEELTLKFGEKLDSLYTPVITYPGSPVLQYHTNDVQAAYSDDVFERDENDFIVFVANPDYVEGGDEPRFTYNKLHSAGDLIFEEDGTTPKLAITKGQVITNAAGEPVLEARTIQQIQTKLVLVDYKYQLVGTHFEDIKAAIRYSIEEDIEPLEEVMFGLTELKYSLSTSIGDVMVQYDSDTSGSITSGMSFVLTVVVDKVTYSDSAVRTLINTNIQAAISTYVNTSKFSSSELTARINDSIGETVEGFNITSINGRSDIINFTLGSTSDVIGVKAVLELGVDNKIKLTPDIRVVFKLAN